MPLPYVPSDDPGWDELRQSQWDIRDHNGQPVEDLPTVLGLIGAGGRPEADQRRILGEWAATAAYVPAPQGLKTAVQAFLSGTEGGDTSGGPEG